MAALVAPAGAEGVRPAAMHPVRQGGEQAETAGELVEGLGEAAGETEREGMAAAEEARSSAAAQGKRRERAQRARSTPPHPRAAFVPTRRRHASLLRRGCGICTRPRTARLRKPQGLAGGAESTSRAPSPQPTQSSQPRTRPAGCSESPRALEGAGSSSTPGQHTRPSGSYCTLAQKRDAAGILTVL